MTAMQWFLIILLVLLIAAGIYLLTRRPSSGSESSGAVDSTTSRDEVTDRDTGGHGAGGDTAVGAAHPDTPPQSDVYDQDAEHRHADAQPAETQDASYTDTASGAQVPVDEDLHHRDVHEGDNDPGGHGASQAFAAGSDDAPSHAASYHSDTGHPGAGSQADTDATYAPGEVGADSPGREPLAGERTYAAPGAEQTDQGHPGAHSQPTHDRTPSPTADDEPHHEHDEGHLPETDRHGHDTDRHVRDNDAAGDTPAGSYAPGSTTAPATDAAEHTDTGHPGPGSQSGDEATYAPGEVGADSPGPEPAVGDAPTGATIADDSDQGHPGPSSQPGTDATYAPTADDVVAESEHRDVGAAQTAWADDSHDDVPADAGSAGFADTRTDEHADDTVYAPVTDETEHPVVEEVVQSPYGPGSAMPAEDGAGPEGWQVKANSGSMLFHTPESPGYASTRAEVWFESEEAARSAGFAHWDRKRR